MEEEEVLSHRKKKIIDTGTTTVYLNLKDIQVIFWLWLAFPLPLCAAFLVVAM
jgi:hypothetical protein